RKQNSSAQLSLKQIKQHLPHLEEPLLILNQKYRYQYSRLHNTEDGQNYKNAALNPKYPNHHESSSCVNKISLNILNIPSRHLVEGSSERGALISQCNVLEVEQKREILNLNFPTLIPIQNPIIGRQPNSHHSYYKLPNVHLNSEKLVVPPDPLDRHRRRSHSRSHGRSHGNTHTSRSPSRLRPPTKKIYSASPSRLQVPSRKHVSPSPTRMGYVTSRKHHSSPSSRLPSVGKSSKKKSHSHRSSSYHHADTLIVSEKSHKAQSKEAASITSTNKQKKPPTKSHSHKKPTDL
ncbi:unnamed protein product, partial [Meganyctiphanes norvegica]